MARARHRLFAANQRQTQQSPRPCRKKPRIGCEDFDDWDVRAHTSRQFADPANLFWNACDQGDISLVQGLLKDDLIDPNNDQPLLIACARGHHSVVDIILRDGRIDPSKALLTACQSQKIHVVKMLLEDPRVQPADAAYIAIREAERSGRKDILRIILCHPKTRSEDLPIEWLQLQFIWTCLKLKKTFSLGEPESC